MKKKSEKIPKYKKNSDCINFKFQGKKLNSTKQIMSAGGRK